MSQNVWATIMPFGPVTLIFYWPQNFFSGTGILYTKYQTNWNISDLDHFAWFSHRLALNTVGVCI